MLKIGLVSIVIALLCYIRYKKKYEKAIIKAMHNAEEANKVKSHFISNISHELKTPLNVIISSIQLFKLTGEKENPHSKHMANFNIMEDNCKRLLRLINNVIDIQKSELNEIQIQLKNIEIVNLIEEIVMSVIPYAQSKNLNLVFDTNEEEVIMAVDSDMIERIILNLLSNAIKFSNEGGSIKVNLEFKKNLYITIEDEGIGINENDIVKIFDNFNQAVHLIPRNFTYTNVVENTTFKTNYAIMGMGMSMNMNNHPLLAEAFNEKGLGCAGLNFPGYAHYEDEVKEGMVNLGVYDVILYILSNFEYVSQVKEAIKNINIVNKEFQPGLQVPTLHWIVSDIKGHCITIEKTKEGMKVYDNKVGVMTNSPTFDYHITNLRRYINLQNTNPSTTKWVDLELNPVGQGIGLVGIPGDFSPPSRFVRTTFLKSNIEGKYDEMDAVKEFFHILKNVSMVTGSVVTPQGKNDITQYISCMCKEKGVYYYTTYNNNQINTIDMSKEDLDRSDMKVFEYIDKQSINYQN